MARASLNDIESRIRDELKTIPRRILVGGCPRDGDGIKSRVVSFARENSDSIITLLDIFPLKKVLLYIIHNARQTLSSHCQNTRHPS